MTTEQQIPNVLVACPTARAKDYCFPQWLESVMSLTYPNYSVVVCDNTKDDGRYVERMNRLYRLEYGTHGERRFKAVKTQFKPNAGVIERIATSHDLCARFAVVGKFDYLLHLESDVFPPKDVIERLMAHKKKVISALYFSDSGYYRRPMVQMRLDVSENFGSSYYLSHKNEVDQLLGDNPKRIALAGMGCQLIRTSVFEKIAFRWQKGVDKHPDTFFAEDCERIGLPIYLDSSIVCEHQNADWGFFGVDYN